MKYLDGVIAPRDFLLDSVNSDSKFSKNAIHIYKEGHVGGAEAADSHVLIAGLKDGQAVDL